jgi:hypothetical protein
MTGMASLDCSPHDAMTPSDDAERWLREQREWTLWTKRTRRDAMVGALKSPLAPGNDGGRANKTQEITILPREKTDSAGGGEPVGAHP